MSGKDIDLVYNALDKGRHNLTLLLFLPRSI
jgi:hypothetical protein